MQSNQQIPHANRSYTLSGEPALFADRGFTAHEYLEDFKLYNMNGRLYDPVVGRFLSPDPYIADPSFTQSYNRYSYVLNNPLKFTDPSGELPFLAWLGIAWAGNYLVGVADNHLNKGMSLKDAFRNANLVAGFNFSPSDMSRSNQFGFSNNQVDALKAALHQEKVWQQLYEFEKSLRSWWSNHFICEAEFRFDQGLQFQTQVKALGIKFGISGEKETEPIAQFNLTNNSSYFYSPDLPSYAYGGVVDPIRTSWSAGYYAGATQSYYSSNKLFKFGSLKSETINLGILNITKLYGRNGIALEKQFTIDFGFDIALYYGFSGNGRVGFKY